MAIDLDFVLLGNERAMEPVYDGPGPMTGYHEYAAERRLHGRTTHEYQESDYNSYGSHSIPLNPYWQRPGDGLYWVRSTIYRSGIADIYSDDNGLSSPANWRVEEGEIVPEMEKCFCKAPALDGHTRCRKHPWIVFDSSGLMQDYPKIHAMDLEKPYWDYSEEELKSLNDPKPVDTALVAQPAILM